MGLIYMHRYGWLNHFRPEPLLPSQVYRLDPHTGGVRVVADGFAKPNGIAFSPNGNVAYMCACPLDLVCTGADLTDELIARTRARPRAS